MAKKFKIEININGPGILDFNSNLGMSGEWGFYGNAFDATHFLNVNYPGDNGFDPPKLYPDSEVTFEVDFGDANPDYVFEIDHIRFSMIGASEFEEATPREAWRYIFDLDKTDGAIGYNGHFFLGQADGPKRYKVRTSPNINNESCNLNYTIRFSIKHAGHIKYCQIDPLIRTSSEYGG